MAAHRVPERRPVGGHPQTWSLALAKSPTNQYIYENLVAVSPRDFNPRQYGPSFYLILNNTFVFTAVPYEGFPPGHLSLSDPQRSWAQITLRDVVQARIYDPFSEGGNQYLSTLDVEIGFAGRKTTTEQLDQDVLAEAFKQSFKNQIFAPGQRVIMDYKNIPLKLTIQRVSLADLSMEKGAPENSTTSPDDRGILVPPSQLNFHKDSGSGINLMASKTRPATNAIVRPSFKFEELGIGGLDTEFATIFRRAFQSRIFPQGLIQALGIDHVKGLLLYGPPGTGKTLIARKIGEMLNARPPKIINGPEVLNKFVGQSEENIRKLFADAEKEYKEKGDDSELHVIIFDELDAVCKQRGSGSAGGTGVGDSVVNQLLSKLDGVEKLNNILLIGMTNRKDMIDDALLRPGRLEVHVEISLPDENGRLQILKIHSKTMRDSGHLGADVDLGELAQRTKNFSGAELSGLVRNASSWALNRHTKGGTMAQISEDAVEATVNAADFDLAFDEIKPAFGASESALEDCISEEGILHFSPIIEHILKRGAASLNHVKKDSKISGHIVLLHGPPQSGKTALAARIALDGAFPFIRLLTPKNLTGLNEAQKIDHIMRIFEDAYKSKLSMIVIDNIEKIIGWNPIGPRFDNQIVQALSVFMEARPPRGRQLVCLATSSDRTMLQSLGMSNIFDVDIGVPTVNTYQELAFIMQQSGRFNSNNALQQALHELQSRHPASDRVGVGIKKIISNIGLAEQNAEQPADMPAEFVELMSEDMIRSNL